MKAKEILLTTARQQSRRKNKTSGKNERAKVEYTVKCNLHRFIMLLKRYSKIQANRC